MWLLTVIRWCIEFTEIIAIVVVAVAFVKAVTIAEFALGTTRVRIGLFVPSTRFGEHSEIMIGKLEIIFGENPVARLLRVAREGFILFQQLGGIAARTIVDPVTGVTGPSVALAIAILTLAAPAATATGLLTIVDQVIVVLA